MLTGYNTHTGHVPSPPISTATVDCRLGDIVPGPSPTAIPRLTDPESARYRASAVGLYGAVVSGSGKELPMISAPPPVPPRVKHSSNSRATFVERLLCPTATNPWNLL